jgi:hypothetical protein
VASRRLDDYLRRLGAAARTGQVDVEDLLRRAILEAARGICSSEDNTLAGESQLEDRLHSIESRLARIEERLAELEAVDIDKLAERVASKLMQILPAVLAQVQVDQPEWVQEIARRVSEEGYVFEHELPPSVREKIDIKVLKSRGFVVEQLGAFTVIADPKAIRGFLDELSRLKTGDEYEAEARLGRYRKLFKLLRSEGYLYYAGPSRGWILEGPLARLAED